MPEKKEIVELGKRQTAILMVMVFMMFILAMVGIFVAYNRESKAAVIAGETVLGAKYYNAEGEIPFEPLAAIPGFTPYKNPNHFEMNWSQGEGSNVAKWNAMYPYRTVLFGALRTSASGANQGYDSRIYVLYSKSPSVSFITFTKLSSRGTWGGLRGTVSQSALSKNGTDDTDEWILMYHDWQGVSEGQQNINTYTLTTYTDSSAPWTFDFDFVYMSDGNGANGVNGLTSISGVPYGYLYYCSNPPGSGGTGGGGDEPCYCGVGGCECGSIATCPCRCPECIENGCSGTGSEPGGGSSGGGGSGSGGGGSSSGGGGSSSGGGGPSSGGGGSSSGGGGSSSEGGGSSSEDDDYTSDYEPPDYEGETNPGTYPWEDDSNIPELDWEMDVPEYPGGTEDDDGEKGDTWELPTYGIPDLPFTTDDLNIPPPPSFDFPAPPGMPSVDPPTLDYQPGPNVGWPPAFPGTN